MAIGFLCFFEKKNEEAIEWYKKILSFDRKTKKLAESGQWNDYRRLTWGAEHGYLYAFPQELKAFSRRQRFAVLVLDFYYCTERFAQALKIADKLQSGEFKKLSRSGWEYVQFARGSCTYWHKGRDDAFREYLKVANRRPSTLTQFRAAYSAGNVGSSARNARIREQARKILYSLATSRKKNDYVSMARLAYGTTMLEDGRYAEGYAMLERVPESDEYHGLAEYYIEVFKKKQKENK